MARATLLRGEHLPGAPMQRTSLVCPTGQNHVRCSSWTNHWRPEWVCRDWLDQSHSLPGAGHSVVGTNQGSVSQQEGGMAVG